MEEGSLPNLASMARNGATGVLRSVIPPLSPSAWPAFYTGKYPGKTGIFAYGNVLKKEHAVESTELVNFSNVDSLTLWRILSIHGYKVGVVNIPVTWPPERVNGFLISSFFTPPDAEEYTYPSSLKEELDDYQIELELPKYGGKIAEKDIDSEELLAEQYRVTKNRMRNVVSLIQNHAPDFFCINFKGVDDVQHFFWHEPAVIKKYLQLIDGYIGELVDLMAPDVTMIMSDHGFHASGDTYFHVNSWLEEAGYLVRSKQLKRQVSGWLFEFGIGLVQRFGWIRNLIPERTKLWAITEQIYDQIDWNATRAHATRWGLYLNEDTVPAASERDSLRERLVHELRDVTDPETGLKVFQNLYRREELYDAGEYLSYLPDIIFLQNERYKINPAFRRMLFAPRVDYPYLTGNHGADPDGVLIVTGTGIDRQKELTGARTVDLAPTVMHIMNVPIPDDLSGRVLTELYVPDSELAARECIYQAYDGESRDLTEWTEEGEIAVFDRLRGLGYVE
jgi:predicted AlkP superfamily phosphohydrolase/phosphomutase